MLLWHSIKTPAIKTETNSAFPSISKTISFFYVKCQKLPEAAEFFSVGLFPQTASFSPQMFNFDPLGIARLSGWSTLF